jgi:hypothetical protein
MTPLAKRRLRLWGMALQLAVACLWFLICAVAACLAAAFVCFIVVANGMNLQETVTQWFRARGWVP